MSARGNQGKKRSRVRATAAERPQRSVLGNDPFERGAAVRAPAVVAPVAAPVAVVPAANAWPAGAVHAPEQEPAALSARAAAPATPEPAPSAAASTRNAPPLEAVRAVRARLEELEEKVEAATGRAASRLEAVPRPGGVAPLTEALRAIASLLPALRQRLEALGSLRAIFVGARELDPHGMDRQLVERLAPIADFLYGSWWRVEARQIENVPAAGPVVVVANHAGVLPWDAFVLRLALLREHPARRELRPLLDDHAFAMRVVGSLAARLGAVRATPENATRLLHDGGVVAVFPEGSAAASRSWHDRYRVERFGRGGFARIALATGATIVPCAIVGSEETTVPLARAGWLSEVVGMPFLASPAPAVTRMPLGALPLPARWSLRFGPVIDPSSSGPVEDEQARVLELTERTRASLQQMLDADVAARRSVYL